MSSSRVPRYSTAMTIMQLRPWRTTDFVPLPSAQQC